MLRRIYKKVKRLIFFKIFLIFFLISFFPKNRFWKSKILSDFGSKYGLLDPFSDYDRSRKDFIFYSLNKEAKELYIPNKIERLKQFPSPLEFYRVTILFLTFFLFFFITFFFFFF